MTVSLPVRAGLAALLLGVLSPDALAADRIVVIVGGIEKQIYLPAKLADQLGYYREQGLDVQLLNEAAGVNAAQEVIAGAAQGAVGFYDHTIDLLGKGRHVLSVVQFTRRGRWSWSRPAWRTRSGPRPTSRAGPSVSRASGHRPISSNSVPRVVLGSVFIIALGLGMASKVALAVVMVFFVVFANAFQGVREADRNLIANAHILAPRRDR